MIGTRELLEEQKKALQRPDVVIPLVQKGKRIDWVVENIAQGLGFTVEAAQEGIFADGRVLNPLVSIWMASHGFIREKDGASGFFVVSRKTSARYRLRVATDKITLTPAISSGAGRISTKAQMAKERAKIDGWAIVFTCDLPQMQIWFVADSMADYFKSIGILDEDWKGDATAIRKNLEAEYPNYKRNELKPVKQLVGSSNGT